jgi:hypothetical protein
VHGKPDDVVDRAGLLHFLLTEVAELEYSCGPVSAKYIAVSWYMSFTISFARRLQTTASSKMGRSTDQILETLLSRPLPPLEPGTKVFDPALTKEIKGSGEHRYVVAGESTNPRHQLWRLYP